MATYLHPAPSILAEASFVYAGGRIPAAEVKRLGERSDGLVLRKAGGAKVARALRQLGYEGPLLFDPSHYEDEWFPGPQTIRAEVERQAQLNVSAFLSPSKFIRRTSVEDLSSVVDDGRSFSQEILQTLGYERPVITVLPLTRYWLTEGLDSLIPRLEGADQRFGVVLGDRTDPLGSARAVKGLQALFASGASVGLLRSDMAAIGALALGASLVAIGTGTSVRHFVPPGMTGGGVSDDKTPSVLVRDLGGYNKGSKLELAKNLDQGFLDCSCVICEGASLTRFGDVRFASEAALHNAEVAYNMSQHIANFRKDLRLKNWALTCAEAIEAHQKLENLCGVPFEPSPQLRAWAAGE